MTVTADLPFTAFASSSHDESSDRAVGCRSAGLADCLRARIALSRKAATATPVIGGATSASLASMEAGTPI